MITDDELEQFGVATNAAFNYLIASIAPTIEKTLRTFGALMTPDIRRYMRNEAHRPDFYGPRISTRYISAHKPRRRAST